MDSGHRQHGPGCQGADRCSRQFPIGLKLQSAMKSIFQYLIAAAGILTIGCAFSHAQVKDTTTHRAKEEVIMPSFMGGDINKFARWVSARIRYPQAMLSSDIEGRVVVKFVIECDGSMTYWELMESTLRYGSADIPINEIAQRASDTLFTREVLRVVRQAPPWKPAMKNGNPVRVFVAIPVNFVLDRSVRYPRTDRTLLPQRRQGVRAF